MNYIKIIEKKPLKLFNWKTNAINPNSRPRDRKYNLIDASKE